MFTVISARLNQSHSWKTHVVRLSHKNSWKSSSVVCPLDMSDKRNPLRCDKIWDLYKLIQLRNRGTKRPVFPSQVLSASFCCWAQNRTGGRFRRRPAHPVRQRRSSTAANLNRISSYPIDARPFQWDRGYVTETSPSIRWRYTSTRTHTHTHTHKEKFHDVSDTRFMFSMFSFNGSLLISLIKCGGKKCCRKKPCNDQCVRYVRTDTMMSPSMSRH